MSTDDRQHEAANTDAGLPVENLNARKIDSETAEQIKGGISITKTTDVSSPLLFLNTAQGGPAKRTP